MSKETSVSSFCFSPTFHPPASGDPSQPMHPVTSALISGVVILGGVSVGFLLLSLHLLQKSRLPTSSTSGVWNPTFKWVHICVYQHLGTKCAECVHKLIMYMCMCAFFVHTLLNMFIILSQVLCIYYLHNLILVFHCCLLFSHLQCLQRLHTHNCNANGKTLFCKLVIKEIWVCSWASGSLRVSSVGLLFILALQASAVFDKSD